MNILSFRKPEQKFRAAMVLCALIGAAISGWRGSLGMPLGLVDALFLPLLIGVALVLACEADARMVGKPIHYSLQWLMVFFWPIAIPAYVLWTRRWRGLLMLLVYAILFCMVTGISAYLANPAFLSRTP